MCSGPGAAGGGGSGCGGLDHGVGGTSFALIRVQVEGAEEGMWGGMGKERSEFRFSARGHTTEAGKEVLESKEGS